METLLTFIAIIIGVFFVLPVCIFSWIKFMYFLESKL